MDIRKDDPFFLGGWIQIGHPACAEILADAGLNWVCVDLEHGVINLETMTNIFRAAEANFAYPVARIPENNTVWIHRVLDAGAKGIIIPMVKTAREAESAVRECQFPPLGKRSFGYSRANQYGRTFKDYVECANKEISVIIQIEHIDAINNLGEILQVPGIEATFIGPYDLSGSLGRPGDFKNREFDESMRRYLKLSEYYKVPTGLHIVHPNKESVAKAVEDGYHLIAVGTDAMMLSEKANEAVDLFEDCIN
jgi:2-dehydro-3-deoxyglucarate aldolase